MKTGEIGAPQIFRANRPIGVIFQDKRINSFMASPAIRRRKLYHEVVDRLLAQIGAGEFLPGSQLPSERALMEMFGTGRSAIREALHSLQRMGVISIRHGERARVEALTAGRVISQIGDIAHFLICSTPQILDHLKRARIAFETAMARDAATLATDADIEKLRQALETHKPAAASDFHRKDIAFHVEIIAIARNPIYEGLAQVMFDLLERFYLNRKLAVVARRITLVEHRRIFERIAARDAAGAAKAMKAHLERAQKLYSQRAERRKPL
jgi:DNA-binding FadR family transcriptional regulator